MVCPGLDHWHERIVDVGFQLRSRVEESPQIIRRSLLLAGSRPQHRKEQDVVRRGRVQIQFEVVDERIGSVRSDHEAVGIELRRYESGGVQPHSDAVPVVLRQVHLCVVELTENGVGRIVAKVVAK